MREPGTRARRFGYVLSVLGVAALSASVGLGARGQSLAESLSAADRYSESGASKVDAFKRAHCSTLGLGIAAASAALTLFIYAAKRKHTSSQRVGRIGLKPPSFLSAKGIDGWIRLRSKVE